MAEDKEETSVRPSTEKTIEQERDIAQTIKSKIQERFGKVFDQETEKIKEVPYEEINLRYHCGDVARITAETVGGKIEEHQARGRNPSILYLGIDGEKNKIASGYTIAIHRYVVDKEGKVWDPITNNWGALTKDEYLQRLASIVNSPTRQ